MTSNGKYKSIADQKTLGSKTQGRRSGTVFHPHPQPLGNRKRRLAHALKPLGPLQLDEGACDALQHRGASLLLVGVKEVEGNFEANQPVRLINPEGNELSRGLCSFSSKELREAIETQMSTNRSPVVVHRDVLVLRNA